MRGGETPVPIPNTTVKAAAAESTLLETAREDRWPPLQESEEREERSGSGLIAQPVRAHA